MLFNQACTNMLWIYFLGIALHCGLKDSCFGTSHVITSTLYKDLFHDHYNKQLLPICQQGGNVTLNLQTALRQIMELNEKEQWIQINIWLRMSWNDCRLKWNSSAYGDVNQFTVPCDALWVPDITVYDSAADEEMMPGNADYHATLTSDGIVYYNFPTVIKTICRVDVTYFPYDTQICNIKFGSWSHHVFDLNLINSKIAADLTIYIPHNEWELVGMPVTRNLLYYKCCKEPYPDLTYHLTMRRKPTFYIMTVFFPCILTSVVAILTFLLPVQSGEKVSLGITVLLSLAVFLLLVAESMPASSESFPYIGMYFVSSMVLVSLSCFMTVIVLNLHYRSYSRRNVPVWMKKVFIDGIGPLLCSRQRKYTVSTLPENNNSIIMDNGENGSIPKEDRVGNHTSENYVTNISTKDLYMRSKGRLATQKPEQKIALVEIADSAHGVSHKREAHSEWHDLARVLDRLFLGIYVVSAVIISATFLGILSKNS